jgi:hypothetical protein
MRIITLLAFGLFPAPGKAQQPTAPSTAAGGVITRAEDLAGEKDCRHLAGPPAVWSRRR